MYDGSETGLILGILYSDIFCHLIVLFFAAEFCVSFIPFEVLVPLRFWLCDLAGSRSAILWSRR